MFEWKSTSPIFFVEETVKEGNKGKTIKGTLLIEGISGNNNLYTIDEMENIANSAVGVPITFGTGYGIDPNTGKPDNNMHNRDKSDVVGAIESTQFHADTRKITFIGRIMNTLKNMHIEETIKEGWGISIDGIANNAKWVWAKIGQAMKPLVKIAGMVVKHVCLVPPSCRRGQLEAKVEGVTDGHYIQETVMDLHLTPEIARQMFNDLFNIKINIEY